MVSIMRVLMECKNGHFGVKFIILCDFLKSCPYGYSRVDDIQCWEVFS
jgi:hypothetical protein